jgi:hypothetical protein
MQNPSIKYTELLIVEVAGTFSCHSSLKGYCHQYRPEEDEFHSVSVLPGGGR